MLVQFYLDEHIGAGLRARGIDVLTTSEAGHLRATDLEQLEFARNQNRVIVTRDADFLVLASQGIEHAGIAFWHSKRRSIGKIVHQLVVLWRTTTVEEIQNQIHFF